MQLISCSCCGAMVSDQAISCPKCGHPLLQNSSTKSPSNPQMKVSSPKTITNEDSPDFVIMLLSLLIPFLGLVWWETWKNEFPNKAEICSKFGWMGFFTYLALAILTHLD